MSQAASQAAAFYRDVVKSRTVWTLKDADGFPAPMTPAGIRAMPFWSSRQRVERIIQTVPAYGAFEPFEVALEDFLARWLSDLEQNQMRVGANWSGSRAVGYDLEPSTLRAAIEAAREGPA